MCIGFVKYIQLCTDVTTHDPRGRRCHRRKYAHETTTGHGPCVSAGQYW